MKKFITAAALAINSVQADADYETNYNVSRSDQKVKYVYQISAQGSHTPTKLLGLAKNKEDEPKYANYVTPLGIRQQYMIGNELRYRYIEEQQSQGGFMDDLYNITQVYIQTSWNDTSILSAQAMLLGLYPPKKNNYVLEESQKYNAVPPIEGFDFKPWIDEMGLEALPHQTTIFPIQMNGWSYDYMLALDDVNCQSRANARSSIMKNFDATANAIADKTTPAMKDFFKDYGWESFCSYIQWAYTESIDLKDEVEKKVPIDKAFDTCQAIKLNQTQQFAGVEAGIKGLTTNDLREHLRDQVSQWLGTLSKSSTHMVQELSQADRKPKTLEGTAGSEHPRYIMFWTNEDLLSMIAQSLSQDGQLSSILPLTPSSTIVLEFTLDSGSNLNVAAFINDQQVTLKGCNNQKTCTAETFKNAINSSVLVNNSTASCMSTQQVADGTKKLTFV